MVIRFSLSMFYSANMSEVPTESSFKLLSNQNISILSSQLTLLEKLKEKHKK